MNEALSLMHEKFPNRLRIIDQCHAQQEMHYRRSALVRHPGTRPAKTRRQAFLHCHAEFDFLCHTRTRTPDRLKGLIRQEKGDILR